MTLMLRPKGGLPSVWATGICFSLVILLTGCTSLEPLTQADVYGRVAKDKETLNATVRALKDGQSLAFADLVTLALANNLDVRLARLDTAIAQGNLDLTDTAKLPSLLLSAGYTFRTPPGTLSDKSPGDAYRTTSSTELSLNLLDFGLAYLRGKSDASQVLIADERRRRTANGIINDVRQAYWQVRQGDARLPALRAISGELNVAMVQSRRLGSSGLQDPLIALAYQEGLLDIQRQIQSYEVEVKAARARLARLLNLPPSTPLLLAANDPSALVETTDGMAQVARATLEDFALAHRTELREQDYNSRSRKIDIIAAYAQILPPLRLRMAAMGDTTSSLSDNHWYEEGFSVAWNAVGIFSALQRASNGRQSLASIELRRLALSLTVMEQVGMAHEQISILRDDHKLAQEQSELKDQIFEIRKIRIPFNEGDELEKVRAALGVASAQIRQDRAFAALQKGHGDLLAALGIDQIPEGFKPDSPTAADDISMHMRQLPATVKALPDRMARELAAP
jgi:outer membrane protein TolC